MKKILIGLIIFFSCSYNTGSNKSARLIYLEKAFPQNILNYYLNKVSLVPIEKVSDTFELRIWSNFIKDSFPVTLQRYYIKEDSLQCDFFLFSDNKNRYLKNIKDLQNGHFDFSKISNSKISSNFFDTLFGKYNLSNLTKLNSQIITDYLSKGYSLGRHPRCLFENVSKNEYNKVFITAPPSELLQSDPNINLLKELSTFCADSVLGKNAEIVQEISTYPLNN